MTQIGEWAGNTGLAFPAYQKVRALGASRSRWLETGGGVAGMPQFSAGAGLQGAATIFPSGGAGESLAFRRTRLRGRPNIAGKRDLGEGLLKGQTTLGRKLWEVVCPRG